LLTKTKVVEKDGFRSLVATEKIRLGETILHLPKIFKETRDKYSIQISENLHVDCSSSFVGAVNHSCDPSASVRHMRLIAWKCIEPGEAITINYRKTESHLSEHFKCDDCGEMMEW
jgi:hypothetical protein